MSSGEITVVVVFVVYFAIIELLLFLALGEEENSGEKSDMYEYVDIDPFD